MREDAGRTSGLAPSDVKHHGVTSRTHADLASRFLLAGGILVMGGIVAAHIGLVNRGAWEPDEYAFIAGFRDDGINFFWERFRTVSPRPLSEVLIILYAWAVITAKEPLIVPALLTLWAGFLASALPTLAGGHVSAPRVLGTL